MSYLGFQSGHAGVQCKERADSLASIAAIDNNIIIDPQAVIECVTELLADLNPPHTHSHSLRTREFNPVNQ